MMRQILFHRQAMEDFDRWLREKPVVHERIRRLIKETAEHPFEGIGKPEPLRHEFRRTIGPHVLRMNIAQFIKSLTSSSSLLPADITTIYLSPCFVVKGWS